ncbi:DUF2442 domain-containing protein [Thermus amyloliquefaciens]|uniref:DUF2442 domain-containing protein n=1 Tax=Thermus amyloliquefaciens TaxID=1449080 RepID=UPI0009DE73F8|nr:DUF2442 domain-containing protein [Thermus amyloliquefaciens]
MWPEVVEVCPLEGLSLWLRFSDGREGVVDLSGLPLLGILERLKDPAFFHQVGSTRRRHGGLARGIDLDPLVLLGALAPNEPLQPGHGSPSSRSGGRP